MLKQYRFPTTAAALIVLAGCGGSVGVAPPSLGQVVVSDTADSARDALGDQLVQEWATAAATTSAQMPTTGYGTYTGLIGLNEGTGNGQSEDYDVASDLTLTANFGDSSIAGSATNFEMYDDNGPTEVISGRVPLTGAISGSDLTASGTGNLSGGGESGTVALDLSGEFVSATAEAVRGDATAVLNAGMGDEPYSGVFIADQ